MGMLSKQLPDSYLAYQRQEYGEPNESFFRGLFSEEPVYSQPWFFGSDSIVLGGRSPDYPNFRNYEEFYDYAFPPPKKEDYLDDEGKFDEDAYNEAMLERVQKQPYY